MPRRRNGERDLLLSPLRTLLDRRDWVYLLSLLIPFIVYNCVLKALEIASLPDGGGLVQTLSLMLSTISFNLGYALLWIGLFAVVSSRSKTPLRGAMVVLFHAVAILVLLVTTGAYLYFRRVGATLEYHIINERLSKFDLFASSLFERVPLSIWILLAAALLGAALGPLLLTRLVERWRVRPETSSSAEVPRQPALFSLGFLLLALGLGSLSVLTGTNALARDPFVNVVLPAGTHPAAHATLAETSQTEKRNVVLVHLESTRARSVTPYDEDLNTTPFLNELAKSSLLDEQAHVGSLPRSSFSNISVNCGIQAPNRLGSEVRPGGVPVPCLAGLLRDQGYSNVFFSSNADEYGDIATKNWGYEEAFAPNDPDVPPQYRDPSMDTQKYTKPSHYGYEEDIMLKPSEEWLKEHKDGPFIAEYMTNTGHDEYNCLTTRYGSENFSNDDLLNHYLNCMRLQDIFLQNLFDQYKELGLYDNTIFVIFGDHGEGFGEHGRFMHGDTIWEEGLRVPLIIHAPGWFEGGQRAEGLSNYTDILPTVLEMLGYEVKDGEYPGYSLLHPLPEDRSLMFSCISRRKCLASIQGDEKYIYHYDNQPEEVYNLSKDPFEEHNLVDEYSKEDLDERRKDLFAWLARIDEQYGYYLRGGGSQENTEQQTDQSERQAAESHVAVGVPLEVGDAEWTVTNANWTTELTSDVDGGKKRGNFVVVDFQLKNNGEEGLDMNSNAVALYNGQGKKFNFGTDTYLYIPWSKVIFRFEVAPGDSEEGQFIFEVPQDASQLQLQLGGRDPFSDNKGYVDLGL
ncbi:MAG: sulfatase-like hydrolase/transferase [Actinomycetota bacterium]|nr:sulfatase-like hydrolase/transferase [Actinomycetota bacterium]